MKNLLNVLIVFLLLLSGNIGYSQKLSEKDSLLRLYKKSTSVDTSLVKVLLNLARLYRLSYPDSAITFSTQGYEAATKLSYEKGIANSLNMIGTSYFYKGDYPMAQEYQQKALAYSSDHHLKAQYSTALNSLALAFQYQGNYIAALESYLKALTGEEESKNYVGQIKVLANIALLYKRQEDFDNSLKYSLKSLALCDSLKDSRIQRANIYNNLGVVSIEQKKYDTALLYIQQSLQLNKDLDNKIFVATGLGNLGYCYLRMNRLPEAKEYVEKGLTYSRELKYSDGIQKGLVNLGDVYLERQEPSKAIPLFLENLSLATSTVNKENILNGYIGLSAAYAKLKDFKTALDYKDKAFDLSDSLKNTDSNKRLTELQKSYELNKKQSEIALLEKEGELRKAELKSEQNLKYGLVGLTICLFILAIVAYRGFSLKSSLNKRLQEQNIEILQQKELIEGINENLKAQALRSQMNPHFIFNSLNSIQYLIIQNHSEGASEYLSKFALLLRKVMDNSEKDFISLTEEIEILTLYLQLESLRFEDSFQYTIENQIENSASLRIPPLVIQPYVENAIHHGLMPKQGNRSLTIRFSAQSGKLYCDIKDNGIGRAEALEISKKRNKLFASKGINNTAQRIQVMNKVFDSKTRINIVDLEDNGKAEGTLVNILFDYA